MTNIFLTHLRGLRTDQLSEGDNMPYRKFNFNPADIEAMKLFSKAQDKCALLLGQDTYSVTEFNQHLAIMKANQAKVIHLDYDTFRALYNHIIDNY